MTHFLVEAHGRVVSLRVVGRLGVHSPFRRLSRRHHVLGSRGTTSYLENDSAHGELFCQIWFSSLHR